MYEGPAGAFRAAAYDPESGAEIWRVAYADKRLTDYEHYLVRKLADLLGLEHHVMIEAKVAVLRELGA